MEELFLEKQNIKRNVSDNITKEVKNTLLDTGKITAKNTSKGMLTSSGKPYKKRSSNITVMTEKPLPVRIIPLGGLNEIGKNITVYECGDDMFAVDCGLAFPDDDMLGIDLVIPDFSYIYNNKSKMRGIVLTHGHEDHIGSLVYFLSEVNVPVYGTRLTIALVESKLKEYGIASTAILNIIKPGDFVKLGNMLIEAIRVNHSIPDAVAYAIHTPAGVIVQTGDFKIDTTPIQGEMIDLTRFGELGKAGVSLLLSDSTNAERPGYTQSERKVSESFDRLFHGAEGKRIITATFSSNIYRIQQIIDAAKKYDRKVAVSGRSMINVANIATEIGYLNFDENQRIDIDAVNKYPAGKVVIITTGSQGEPMSALTRMAFSDHRKVEIGHSDIIIISANPIPGNEKVVGKVINELMKLGAEVIYEDMYEVHVSGHACQGELSMMLALTKPKFFFPVHGEQKHLSKHAAIAAASGVEKCNITIPEIGKVYEFDGETIKVLGTVPSGRVLVDGSGIGDVGSIVLRDRKHLAQDGLIVVVATIDNQTGRAIAGPDIVSRGFVYVRESEILIEEARNCAKQTLENCADMNIRDWNTIKVRVKEDLSKLFYERTKRNPMVLPVIMEV
jgi:ribonuclease J